METAEIIGTSSSEYTVHQYKSIQETELAMEVEDKFVIMDLNKAPSSLDDLTLTQLVDAYMYFKNCVVNREIVPYPVATFASSICCSR